MIPLKTYIIGARDSLLSRAQCEEVHTFITGILPRFCVEWQFFSTPGDRDRITPLPATPADFFTRDLDDAIRAGTIDAAVHSAKDLPPDMPDDIDWFRLPESEDPRDVLLTPEGRLCDDVLRDTHNAPRIGISSVRREKYARERFPHALCQPVRGNVDDRCAQMNRGDYDMLILAAAGVHRLNFTHLIAEYISLDALVPPDGQGKLALTFSIGHPFWTRFRHFCIPPVIFAGAGTGTPGCVTHDVSDALNHCTVCLHDADTSDILAAYLPSRARAVYVGKRAGENSISQDTIDTMLATYTRCGEAVVRLKGGDPGIFGRLAEEIAVMDYYALPYRVLPGVSSLLAGTTTNGFFLTRRGGARGFTALTTRTAGSGASIFPSAAEERTFSRVFFMGIHTATALATHLLESGMAPATPVAIVARAGRSTQDVLTMTLEMLAHTDLPLKNYTPGLLLVGEFADKAHRIMPHGPLAGMRVALAVSTAISDTAARAVRRFMGTPVLLPMISLEPCHDADHICAELPTFEWLILSSPTAVEILCELMRQNHCDLRTLPRLLVSGPRTAAHLEAHGIYAITVPQKSFGIEGIVHAAKETISREARILRLRSDAATDALTQQLRKCGFSCLDDRVLYTNTPRTYTELPSCDAIVFSSASQVHSYAAQTDTATLSQMYIAAIGESTVKALRIYVPETKIILSPRSTIEATIVALAADIFSHTFSHTIL